MQSNMLFDKSCIGKFYPNEMIDGWEKHVDTYNDEFVWVHEMQHLYYYPFVKNSEHDLGRVYTMEGILVKLIDDVSSKDKPPTRSEISSNTEVSDIDEIYLRMVEVCDKLNVHNNPIPFIFEGRVLYDKITKQPLNVEFYDLEIVKQKNGNYRFRPMFRFKNIKTPRSTKALREMLICAGFSKIEYKDANLRGYTQLTHEHKGVIKTLSEFLPPAIRVTNTPNKRKRAESMDLEFDIGSKPLTYFDNFNN